MFGASLGPQKKDYGIKAIEDYWIESGLRFTALTDLVNNENCSSNDRSYLACVNAISYILEKRGLALEFDGSFRKFNRPLNWNEKLRLTPWTDKILSEKPDLNFTAILAELRQRHLSTSEATPLIALGINAYYSVARDPHSYIIPLKYYDEVLSRTDTRFQNLGLITSRKEASILIRKVINPSPAFSAGLRRGDEITELNGEEVRNLDSSDVADILRMKDRDQINFKITRKSSTLRINVPRSDELVSPVFSKILNRTTSIGVVAIHRFSKGVCERTKAKIADFSEGQMKGIMLDLRDNPGGQVDEAACVISLFVPKNQLLFETRYLDSGKEPDQYFSKEDPVYLGPLAVLINGGSASASEIVAGSLRDLGRAKLVGEKSFGKGSFQDGRIWTSNSNVAVFETAGLYYFPSGWTPQLVGLTPDLEVKDTLSPSDREEDLYFNPLRPSGLWTGPQSVGFLEGIECLAQYKAGLGSVVDDDQLSQAEELLNCQSSASRNGAL